jgi:hypothetical protein
MKTFLLALAITLAATSASAQDITAPIKYTWIVTSCETWDCASSALLLSHGDGNTIVLPTKNEERPWLVVRRVEEGSIYIPEDEPFHCEVFDDFDNAADRYSDLGPCRLSTVMNMMDGQSVVLSLRKCDSTKRRAVTR